MQKVVNLRLLNNHKNKWAKKKKNTWSSKFQILTVPSQLDEA